MTNLISLCIVVKNEEENLKELLPMIRPFVDEILISDTGSTDETLLIASFFADKIFDVPTYNVSQGRNIAIESATGKWILTLDADERILPQDMLRLRNDILDGLDTVAYRLPIFNYLGMEKWSVSCVIRLFRQEYKGTWNRTMHESLSATFSEHFVGFIEEISVHHFSRFTSSKKTLYLEKMKKYLSENKNDNHALEHYACELFTDGNSAEGISLITDVIKLLPDFQRAYKDLAYMYLLTNQFEKAANNFKFALECTREQTCLKPALYCGLGQVFYMSGNYDKAIESLEDGIKKSTGNKSALNLNLSVIYARIEDMNASKRYKKCAIQENTYLLSESVLESKPNNNTIYSLDCIII